MKQVKVTQIDNATLDTLTDKFRFTVADGFNRRRYEIDVNQLCADYLNNEARVEELETALHDLTDAVETYTGRIDPALDGLKDELENANKTLTSESAS